MSYHTYDQDPPLVVILAEERPTGRKDYLCCMCGRWIAKGERHRKTVYLDDDLRFHSMRYHTICYQEGA